MAQYAAESGHWYTRDGEPAYTVIGKNGKERPTTVRDARERGLATSVTGVIKCAAVPTLEHWIQQQVMLSTLTLPRHPDETESFWIERVWADSREQARKARERGTAIHGSIQCALEGNFIDPQYDRHVAGALATLEAVLPMTLFRVERSFCHTALGYGGKVDIHTDKLVVDIKTKEFDEAGMSKLTTYDEHAMQIAAYREGLRVPSARGAILYVSASVPGLAKLLWIDEKELVRGWHMFVALLRYWQHKNKYVWEPSKPLLGPGYG